MSTPIYEFSIRTSEAQARHVRRRRARQAAVALVALAGAFLAPAGIEGVDPSICAHTWVC